MALRAMDLFDAYTQGMLPKDEGYVVSGFFIADSAYSIIEVVSYSEVKAFYATDEGVTFQSNGKKIYILVEPSIYSHKATEPYVRPSVYQIPLRFNDLNIYTAKNQYRIMYSKEPLSVMTSFTVLKSRGENFSFILFLRPDIKETLSLLFEKSFRQNSNIPQHDAKKVSAEIADVVLEKLCWPNKKAGQSFESINKKEL